MAKIKSGVLQPSDVGSIYIREVILDNTKGKSRQVDYKLTDEQMLSIKDYKGRPIFFPNVECTKDALGRPLYAYPERCGESVTIDAATIERLESSQMCYTLYKQALRSDLSTSISSSVMAQDFLNFHTIFSEFGGSTCGNACKEVCQDDSFRDVYIDVTPRSKYPQSLAVSE